MAKAKTAIIVSIQFIYISITCYLFMWVNEVLCLYQHYKYLPKIVKIGYLIGCYPIHVILSVYLVYLVLLYMLCLRNKVFTVIEYSLLFVVLVNMIVIGFACCYLSMY